MQLIGYRKSDNRVVFKSTAHDSKAWDVEGSLNVPAILPEMRNSIL